MLRNAFPLIVASAAAALAGGLASWIIGLPAGAIWTPTLAGALIWPIPIAVMVLVDGAGARWGWWK